MNDRGSYYFMSLDTGKCIHSTQWTEIPITNEVIQRVEEIVEENGMEPLVDEELIFEWEPGRPIEMNYQEDVIPNNDIVNNHIAPLPRLLDQESNSDSDYEEDKDYIYSSDEDVNEEISLEDDNTDIENGKKQEQTDQGKGSYQTGG